MLIIARRGRGSGRCCTSEKPYKAAANSQLAIRKTLPVIAVITLIFADPIRFSDYARFRAITRHYGDSGSPFIGGPVLAEC
jgi:hypothetical protein